MPFRFLLRPAILLSSVLPLAAVPPAPAAAPQDKLPEELIASLRMYGAHAPLRDPEVANPNSASNRAVLEQLLRLAYFSPSEARQTFDPAAAPDTPLVGALAGSFSLDDRGRAEYQLTLPVPPHRGEVGPQLSLGYSSTAGEGPLGRGFYLGYGHAGAITRGRTLLARDGEVRSAEASRRDFLYLDGKRLLCLSGPDTYGRPGSRYRTEVDSFLAIVAGGGGATADRFVATDSQGRKYHFGRYEDADDARQAGWDEDAGALAAEPLTFALKRIEDASGNYVEFHYEHAGFGEWLLSRIDYTGGSGVPPPFSIHYRYEPGAVRIPVYEAMQRVDANHLLRQVEIVAHPEEAVVRRFHFTYVPGAGPQEHRLVAVNEESAADVGEPLEALPPTTFGWGGVPAAEARAVAPLPGLKPDAKIALGDFDGDGKTDVLEVADGLRVHRSGREGPVATSSVWVDAPALTLDDKAPSDVQVLPGDFNGDGATDALLVRAGRARLFLAAANRFEESVQPAAVGPASSADSHLTAWVVLDATGDGRADLLVHAPGRPPMLYVSDGKILHHREDATRLLADAALANPGAAQSADFNQDGLEDYAWADSSLQPDGSRHIRVRVSLATAAGTFEAPETVAESSVGAGKSSAGLRFWVADFNGDSLADLLTCCDQTGAGQPVDAVVHLSRGRRGRPAVALPASFRDVPASLPEGCDPSRLALLDADGDGLADLVWPGPGGIGWHSRRSRGDGTFDPTRNLAGSPWSSAPAAAGAPQLLYDLNGDGWQDWVFLPAGIGARGAAWCPGGQPDDAACDRHTLVTRLSDAYGSRTQVAYRAGRNDAAVAPAPAVRYPIRNFPSGQPVAVQVWKDDGGETSRGFSYRYSGRHLDYAGRGGMGFTSMVTLDRETGFGKYQFLAKSFPMTGLTVRERTYWGWNDNGSILLKLIAAKDSAVSFDAVRAGDGTLTGSLHPFTSRVDEQRWAADFTADFLLTPTAATPRPKKARPPVTERPVGMPAERTVTSSWFDGQDIRKLPATQLPLADLPYPVELGTGLPGAAPAPDALARAAAALPGLIRGGQKRATLTQEAGATARLVVNTFADQALPGDPGPRRLTSTTVHGGGSPESPVIEPVKSWTYLDPTPFVATETSDGGALADPKQRERVTITTARDPLGRIKSQEKKVKDLQHPERLAEVSVVYFAQTYDDAVDLPRLETTPKNGALKLAYNRLFGEASRITFENGVTAVFRYDGLGRLRSIVNDAGWEKHIDYAWTTDTATDWQKRQWVSGPAEAAGFVGRSVHAVRTAEEGEATVIRYFDRISREIRTVTIDAAGHEQWVDHVFGKIGYQVAESKPYVPGSAVTWTITAYDGYGRPASERTAEAPATAAVHGVEASASK